MNRLSKKIISAALCLSLTFGCSAMAVSAQDTDCVTRVSVSMNGDSQTSRGFCWYTQKYTRTDVQIVKSADFKGNFDNADLYSAGTEYEFRGMYCHKVTVTDLEKGTEYTYRVGDKSLSLWSDAGTFVTDDGDNSFSFITIADVQASSDENFAQAAKVMQGAVKTCPESEFSVNLGDFVNDDNNDEWNWYFSNFNFANSSTTLVPVAGNHDGNITNKLNINVFNSMFNLSNENTDSKTNWVNGVYYSYDYGNAHFAVLNTNDMYPMTQSQRNWLINDMKKSDADWKFVLMHRAPYAEGKNINKPDTIIMRDVLIPLFDELDIDVVYAGHDHCYYRSTQVKGDAVVENVNYVTEVYNNEQTNFAVNPDGTVYILPSTAGTKRYTVHEAIDPISDCCAFRTSTRDLGGCFMTTTIDGDRLIVKSYVVDDETQEITLIDQYAIKKDLGQNTVDPDYVDLPTDNNSNISAYVNNFVKAIVDMLIKYITVLVPQLIKGLFK